MSDNIEPRQRAQQRAIKAPRSGTATAARKVPKTTPRRKKTRGQVMTCRLAVASGTARGLTGSPTSTLAGSRRFSSSTSTKASNSGSDLASSFVKGFVEVGVSGVDVRSRWERHCRFPHVDSQASPTAS